MSQTRQGVIILGMHRSGTSALTRVLSLLGYALPRDVTGKAEGNMTGHWESASMMALNDRLLSELRLSWDSWHGLQLNQLGLDRKQIFIDSYQDIFIEVYNNQSDFVLKDPRLCRTAPIWLRAMKMLNITPKIILPIRNPLEVASSLEKRNGFSKAKSALIWLSYVIDAEHASRGYERVVTFYDQLLDRPKQTINHILTRLALNPPISVRDAGVEFERFLQPNLRHHKFSQDDLVLNPITKYWVSDVYQAFLLLKSNPDDSKALRELDRVRVEMTRTLSLFEIIDQDQQQNQKNLIVEHQAAVGKLSEEIKSLIAAHDKDIKILTQELERGRETVKLRDTTIIERQAAVEKLSKEIVGLNQFLTDSDGQLQFLRDNYTAQMDELRALLAKEQRSIIKPIYRRLRRLGGSILRIFLPNSIVDKFALILPTSEQKVIKERREREKTSAATVIVPMQIKTELNLNTLPDIFIFAIISWHFRIQRPQHIARELSRLGYRVFYFEMDPPISDTEMEQLDDNLFRVKLKPDQAAPIPAYVGTSSPEQEKGWLSAFYRFCDEVQASSHKITIIQHPFWWQLVRLLTPEHWVLYDCMDDISGFQNTTAELLALEHNLLEGCDNLVVSASNLKRKYEEFNPVDVIRNATEVSHFVQFDQTVLEDKFRIKALGPKSTSTIKVGYVGAIADWFDSDLLCQVARSRPDVEFHLCGHVSADHPRTLQAEPNIHMYGEIPYNQVPAFLSQMEILSIPFKIDPIIEACDPVKFYEYCALGKPTVTTPLPELERVKDICYMADGAQEFANQIDKAYQDRKNTAFIKSIKSFAHENSWAHRARQFNDVITQCHPKISVIILAYGDPNLTNTALSSLKAQGDHYPNMEILIIDNGSTIENLAIMHHYAAQFSDVRIIENGKNLGFAAGNNVGLKAATGDYVMLLNNDTFISPGALYGMVRHLQNNPKVGVVGSLTNNIGNEAKLDIVYESMEQMIPISRALKTGYRGHFIKVKTAAYFGVMFRTQDFEKFGPLSEEYGRGMFEDDDHCKTIQSWGYQSIIAEDVFIHHHLSASFSKINNEERQRLFDRNKAIFEKKWGPWIPHEYRTNRPNSDLQFPNKYLAL